MSVQLTGVRSHMVGTDYEFHKNGIGAKKKAKCIDGGGT